jgi:hypothetical protein
MKRKWQLPIILRLYRGASIIWLGIEWRSPRYRPIDPGWDMSELSGMLKSYDD